MNAPRLSPAAACAAALAIGAALAGCGAPPAKRFSEAEPLRTADIANAPQYVAVPDTPAPEAVPPQAASAPAPPRAADVAPRAQPAAAAPVTEAATKPPAPASSTAERAAPPSPAPLAPGRWTVQVGVFAVPANAERDRARVAARLASTDVAPAQRIVRVERIGDRSHVLVGDLPDREAALALAAQLRRALKQDVVVLRR
ncbi:MAG: SPOR domain-containing protein [Pseudomonadota bacterium]